VILIPELLFTGTNWPWVTCERDGLWLVEQTVCIHGWFTLTDCNK